MQNPRKKEKEKEISPNIPNFFSPNRVSCILNGGRRIPNQGGQRGGGVGLGWVRFRIFQTFLKDATRFFFSFSFKTNTKREKERESGYDERDHEISRCYRGWG